MLLHLALKGLMHNSFTCKNHLEASLKEMLGVTVDNKLSQPTVSVGTKKPNVGVNYLIASLDWSGERENQLYGPRNEKKKFQRNLRKYCKSY